MARAILALAAVSTALSPKNLAKRCALLCSLLAARGLPGNPPAPVLRIARTAIFAGAAATAAVGGFALAGFDPSIATAPLVEDADDEGEALLDDLRADMRAARITADPAPALPLHDEIVTLEPDGAVEDDLFVYQGGRLTEEQVKALARQAGWPEHVLAELVEVAWCESRYDPQATNGIIRGLMQVHHLWFAYSGTDFSLWADPLVNLRVALVAYNYDIERGYIPWNQWECRPGGRTGTPNAHLFADPEPSVEAAADSAGDEEETPTPEAETPAAVPPEKPPAETPTATETPAGGGTPTQEPKTPPADQPPTEEPAPASTVEAPPTPPGLPEE